MLTGVTFPQPPADMRGYYYKLGKRKADAISIVSVAITLSFTGKRVDAVRIGLGAVAPVALRAHAAEAELSGRELTPERIAAAAAAAANESSPIDEYRRNMVRVLVSRGLHELAQNG